MLTYTIQNSNFINIYNSLNANNKSTFRKVDIKAHEYSASLLLWQKVLKIHNNFLYILHNKLKADDAFIIKTINNIINNNLININDMEYPLVIKNDKKTLAQWNKTINLPKHHCLYLLYILGIDSVKEIISSFYDNYHNTSSLIDINLQNTGILLTYNDITNNIYGWKKLLQRDYVTILSSMKKNTIKQLFSILHIKPQINNFFEINGIYASYENWSMFINENKNYLEDMVYSMGYNYARNHLYNKVVNNTEFITKHIEITINNQTLSIYKWAQKINKSTSYLYNLRSRYGIEYVINYICGKL